MPLQTAGLAGALGQQHKTVGSGGVRPVEEKGNKGWTPQTEARPSRAGRPHLGLPLFALRLENSTRLIEMCQDLFEYKCWKYYSWNCQGDVGGWALVYVDEACVNHLILANEWMMCDEYTYCGNIILEQEVLENLK